MFEHHHPLRSMPSSFRYRHRLKLSESVVGLLNRTNLPTYNNLPLVRKYDKTVPLGVVIDHKELFSLGFKLEKKKPSAAKLNPSTKSDIVQAEETARVVVPKKPKHVEMTLRRAQYLYKVAVESLIEETRPKTCLYGKTTVPEEGHCETLCDICPAAAVVEYFLSDGEEVVVSTLRCRRCRGSHDRPKINWGADYGIQRCTGQRPVRSVMVNPEVDTIVQEALFDNWGRFGPLITAHNLVVQQKALIGKRKRSIVPEITELLNVSSKACLKPPLMDVEITPNAPQSEGTPVDIFASWKKQSEHFPAEPILVGGAGDCWMQMGIMRLGDPTRMTAEKFVERMEERFVMYRAVDAKSRKKRCRLVKFEQSSDRDWHIVDFNVINNYASLKEMPPYMAEKYKDYICPFEMVRIMKERGYTREVEQDPEVEADPIQEPPETEIVEDDFQSNRAYPKTQAELDQLNDKQVLQCWDRIVKESTEILVGSSGSAVDMVAESARVNQVDMAKLKALEVFNQDLANTPTTPIRMSPRDLKQFGRYAGFQIMSTQASENTSTHVFLEVARGFCRTYLDRRYPQRSDASVTLHVGATIREIRRWWSHAGHDFYVAMKESKDNARMVEDTTNWVVSRMRFNNLTALQAREAVGVVMLQTGGLEQLLKFADTGPTPRIHFKGIPDKPYTSVLYEDSLYDMSANEVLSDWNAHGYQYGYAVLFIPDAMLSPDASISDIYEMRRYLPPQDVVLKLLDDIWPEILLFTPLIPLGGFTEALHNFLVWLITHSWDRFKELAEKLAKDKYPLEMFFGISLDLLKLGPIMVGILDQLLPWLFDRMCRVSVTWKNGFGNGYDNQWHTWQRWALNRRIPGNDFNIDSEIVYKVGEMYVLRMWRSDGKDPVVSRFELPKERRCVLVGDIMASYSRITGALGPMKYFPVLEADWMKLYNWGMSQPIESLDFSVMATTLNQIRRGLHTGSRTLVDAMELPDTQVTAVSLACLMEIFNKRAMLSEIEENQELRDGYQTNLKLLLKTLATTGATLATGGLAIPAYYLYKWLTESKQSYQYVKWPSEPEVRVEKRHPKELKDTTITLAIPEQEEEEVSADNPCMLCGLRASGALSQTGIVSEGQQFALHRHSTSNEVTVGFDQDQVTALVTKLVGAQIFHVGVGANAAAEAIRNLKHFFETNQGGISTKMKIDHVSGGPGTGKSVLIRSLAAQLEDAGESVAIFVPFAELTNDYKFCNVINKGTRTFSVDTTYYSSKRSNHKYLIVDEAGAADWDIVKATAIFIGAQYILLAGDYKQTLLRRENGEGTPCLDAPDLDLKSMPEHELVYNYRLGAWRTKMLNHVYKYRMIAKREDKDVPIRKTVEEYNVELPDLKKRGTLRQMVFAHNSAPVVFGCTSTTGTDDNLSVRTAQGLTFKNSALSASDHDGGVIDAHGMSCVALSRSSEAPIVVCPASINDPIPERLAEKHYFDSQENIDFISSLSWPTVEQVEVSKKMPALQRIFNERLNQAKKEGRLTVRGGDFVEVLSATDIYVGPEEAAFKMTVNVRDQFQLCVFDGFLNKYPEKIEEVEIFLWTLYSNDDLMGRTSMIGRFCSWVGAKEKPLPTVDNKKLIPMSYAIKFMEKTCPLVVYQGSNPDKLVDLKPTYMSPMVRKGIKPGLILFHSEKHVTVVDPPIVKVRRFGQVFSESSLSLIDGKFVYEYPREKNIFVVSEKELPPDRPKIDVENLVKTVQDAIDKSHEPIMAEIVPDVTSYDVKYFRPINHFQRKLEELRTIGEIEYLDVVGWKPVKRIHDVDWDVKYRNLAENRRPYYSKWMTDPKALPMEDPIDRSKLRFGTNMYLLRDFIDDSGAYKDETMRLNDDAPFAGQPQPTNVKLNWEGFIWERTRAGKLKKAPRKPHHQINPGLACHYDSTPMETFVAAGRYGRLISKPRLHAENKRYAEDLAKRTFHANWERQPIDELEENFIIHGALKAAKQRNYHVRAEKTWHTLKPDKAIFSPKAQVKPIKNDKLNLDKGGQGIMQTPPIFNLEWIAWARVLNYRMKKWAKPNYFIDDRESALDFRTRLTQAIQQMPESARFAVVDAVSFDSQQNEVTVYAEKCLMHEFGMKDSDIDDFQKWRRETEFWAPGLFKGEINGDKGSGFLDTKSMNTALETMCSQDLTTGVGEKIEAAKGDDDLVVQCGLKENEQGRKNILTYFGMTQTVDIGDGAEFIGTTVSRAGMYKNPVRVAHKSIGHHIRDEKHFVDVQKSWRDNIREWRDSGLKETIAFSADTTRSNNEYVEMCVGFIDSLSHLTWSQFSKISKKAKPRIYRMPSPDYLF